MTNELYTRFGIDTSVVGQDFEKLTAIGASFYAKVRRDGRNRSCVVVRCVCGQVTVATLKNLKNKHVQSCGCFSKKLSIAKHTTHGQSKTGYYRLWTGMLKRCFNPRCAGFKYYGGRGITVCERWRNSFENFCDDMGPRPSSKHSIDRIANAGNYEPGNCQWATQKSQCRNSRRNHHITLNGDTRCVSEWAELFGIRPATIFARLSYGWTESEAVTRPVKRAAPTP